MNLTSQDRELLHQQMDACRPGSDDLALPEMAQLSAALPADAALRAEWESRQRSERVIAAAMHDITVPAGLADRILAAAAAAREESRLADVTEEAVSVTADPDAHVGVDAERRSALLTRRKWAWIGGVAILLVAAIAVAPFLRSGPQQVSKEQLFARAQGWFDEAVQPQGNARTDEPPIPFPASAVKLRHSGWRRIESDDVHTLVAFDLTNLHTGGRVFLFAAQTRDKYEVGSIPYTNVPATGGLAIGAWQVGDQLYVVVIDQQRSGLRLDAVIKTPGLAMSMPRR